MEGYIIIRKRTLARAIVALCAVAIGLLAWLCFSVVCSDEPPRRVAVRSFNALQADGKDVAFFSSISADSTLEGLCLDSSNVTFAPRIALHGAGLRSVLRYTKDSLRRRAARLEASIGEMDYYLKVHGVQDEGYDMVGCNAAEFSEDVDHPNASRIMPETHDQIVRFAKRRAPFVHPTFVVRRAALEAALLMKPMPTSGEKVSYYICKLDGKKNPDWKCARPVELYDRKNLPYDAQYYLKKIDDWQKRFAELSGASAVPEADSKPSQAELF